MKDSFWDKFFTDAFLILFVLLLVRWSFVYLKKQQPKRLLLKLWAYIRNPYYIENVVPVENCFLTLWRFYKLDLNLMIWAVIPYIVITTVLEASTNLNFDQKDKPESIVIIILSFVVFAPLIEEAVFRLPLRPTKFRFISIMSVFLSVIGFYVYKFIIMFHANHLLIPITISITILLVLGIILTQLNRYYSSTKVWFKKYFNIIFWILCISFGFIHITNFEETTLAHYLIIPILTLPQLVLGFLNGFVRMRYGFWYAVGLHALNNTLPALAYIFEKVFP